MVKLRSGMERREFIRVDEEDLLVCEPFDPTDFSNSVAGRIRTLTKNLSENGILFELNEPYPVGKFLRLQIDIPGWEKYKNEFFKANVPLGPQPLIVLGKVVRVEDIGGGRFDMGIVFAAVDKDHRIALKRYLDTEKIKK